MLIEWLFFLAAEAFSRVCQNVNHVLKKLFPIVLLIAWHPRAKAFHHHQSIGSSFIGRYPAAPIIRVPFPPSPSYPPKKSSSSSWVALKFATIIPQEKEEEEVVETSNDPNIDSDDSNHGDENDNDNDDCALDVLAGNIAICLHKSDLKRDDGLDGASTGWTSWVDGEAALRLQSCMDALELPSFIRNPQQQQNQQQQQQSTQYEKRSVTTMEKRDEAIRWIRWIKACPSPLIMELSTELRQKVNATIPNDNDGQFLKEIDCTDRDSFLKRIGCRLIVLPSGSSLSQPLRAPPGAMIYGKLLLGGVTRFRMIGSSSSNRPRRRAGARTLITSPAREARTSAWLQYGGPERSYEAVDAGPCAFLEVLILPKGLSLPLVVKATAAPIASSSTNSITMSNGYNRPSSSTTTSNTPPANIVVQQQQQQEEEEPVGDTTISQIKWNLDNMLDLVSEEEAAEYEKEFKSNNQAQGASSSSSEEQALLSGNEFVQSLENKFTASVGGLKPQIDSIIRRVLDGRALAGSTTTTTTYNAAAAASDEDDNDDESHQSTTASKASLNAADVIRRKEMEALLDLGLQPVRGLLLYGPPGTGKTLVAREIAGVLTAREPKIIAAPELLDRWVGGSEKLVRDLFKDAEDELRMCKDPTESALHVIVIDEIDAVFRKRSVSTEDSSGEVTRASAVNQILAKLDGVKELGNILLIGMTNRRELLDEALLRPGRLEVQIEIPLPDKEGRREILQIHFEALRRKGCLSRPLCCAIDGIASGTMPRFWDEEPNSLLDEEEKTVGPGRKRRAMKRAITRVVDSFPVSPVTYDLAADYATAGFSGADIAGLVRCAGSRALARTRKAGNGIESLLITLEDAKLALKEVKS